jgi:hypothetical protein
MRRTLHCFVLVTLVAPGLAGAQTTPWGDPDLQGIWSNQTPVPLERPAALANKPYFTETEAAEVEKNALASVLKNIASEIATSGSSTRSGWSLEREGSAAAVGRRSWPIRRMERSPSRQKAEPVGRRRRIWRPNA